MFIEKPSVSWTLSGKLSSEPKSRSTNLAPEAAPQLALKSDSTSSRVVHRIALLMLAATTLTFTNPGHADETQYWNSLQFTSKLNDEQAMLGELNHRYSNQSKEFVVRSVRLGTTRKFAENWTAGLILENRKTNNPSNDEIRLITQLSRKWKFEALDLNIRGRFEFREFADTSAVQNRVRVQTRLDGTSLEFAGITPWTSYEHFQILNTVGSRPEGSTETRMQLGLSFEAWTADIEVAYLDRTVTTAAFRGASAKSSRYQIANTSLKWSF